MAKKCEYYLNPEDPDTWPGNKEATPYIPKKHRDPVEGDLCWKCPHKPVQGENLCPFHLGAEEVSKRDMKVGQQLYEHIKDACTHSGDKREKRLQFYGTQLDSGALNWLSIDDLSLNSDDRIQLGCSKIYGELLLDDPGCSVNFSGSKFEGGINIKQSEFSDAIFFKESKFKGKFEIGNVVFDVISFDNSIFNCSVDMNDVNIESIASFSKCEFRDSVSINNCSFGECNFEFSRFDQLANFRSNTFNGLTQFYNVSFFDECIFNNSTFKDEADFREADFRRPVQFRLLYDNNNSEIIEEDDTVKLSYDEHEDDPCLFSKPVDFEYAHFEQIAHFESVYQKNGGMTKTPVKNATIFGDEVIFDHAQMEQGGNFAYLHPEGETSFEKANIRNSDFREAYLCKANFEQAGLQQVCFFGTNLQTAKLYGAILTDAQISPSTVFGNHYDTDKFKQRVWTQQAIEKLGMENGIADTAKSAYKERKDARKDKYREDCCRSEYYKALASKYFWGYGESIARIITASSFTVFVFGVLYTGLGGVSGSTDNSFTLTYLGPWIYDLPDALNIFLANQYFSLVTFTSLGYGDLLPAGALVKAFAATEAAIGALFMAAIAFVLGRRATRY